MSLCNFSGSTVAVLVMLIASAHLPAAEVSRDGACYQVYITHDDLSRNELDLVALIPGEVGAALAMSVEYLRAVDFAGGKNGVDITGVIGLDQKIVTPHGMGIMGKAVAALNGAPDFLKKIVDPTKFPDLLKDVWNSVPHPGGSGHGEVHADENEARSEETLIMVTLPDSKVAFLSYRGYVCADDGGNVNDQVWANRPSIGDWEKWSLIRNGDGTISLKSWKGMFMSTDYDHGEKVVCNRKNIGDWEKFDLVFLSNGRVALRAHVKQRYFSVAP